MLQVNILDLNYKPPYCTLILATTLLIAICWWVRVARSLVLCVLLCRSLFVLLYFFFWPLCCLFFFDIQILITTLVSSNSSSICEGCHFTPLWKTLAKRHHFTVREGLLAIKLVQLFHFLLKCLDQVKKVSGVVYV